jgi:hypothetical protein
VNPALVRRGAGLLLVLHGIAHLPGAIGAWQLAKLQDLPYSTVVLDGHVDVGDVGMAFLGVIWLIASVAVVAAGISVWRGDPRAIDVVAGAATVSLAICLVGLPAAAIGVWVDVAVLVVAAERWIREPAVTDPV